ncbi:hypothetical protein ACRAWD_29215 [Caulobacter segnis]
MIRLLVVAIAALMATTAATSASAAEYHRQGPRPRHARSPRRNRQRGQATVPGRPGRQPERLGPGAVLRPRSDPRRRAAHQEPRAGRLRQGPEPQRVYFMRVAVR